MSPHMRLPTGITRVAVPLLTAALLATAAVLPTAAGADETVPVSPPTAAPTLPPKPTLPPAPLPRVKNFRPVADDLPRAERESTCSPTEKPGAIALRTLLRRTYGKAIGS